MQPWNTSCRRFAGVARFFYDRLYTDRDDNDKDDADDWYYDSQIRHRSQTQACEVWDISERRRVCRFQLPHRSKLAAWSPDGAFLFILVDNDLDCARGDEAARQTSLRIYDAGTGACLLVVECESEPQSAVWHPAGSCLWVACKDHLKLVSFV